MNKKKVVQPKLGMGPVPIYRSVEEFWGSVFQDHGRSLMFIDTGAILYAIRPDDEFAPFLDSLVGYRLVTSTYVIHETIRQLMKSGLPGAGGRVKKDAAIHFLNTFTV